MCQAPGLCWAWDTCSFAPAYNALLGWAELGRGGEGGRRGLVAELCMACHAVYLPLAATSGMSLSACSSPAFPAMPPPLANLHIVCPALPSPRLPPASYLQIHFVSYEKKGDNGKIKSLMSRYFDSELTEWLVREMGENRDKMRAKLKSYSYPGEQGGLVRARAGMQESNERSTCCEGWVASRGALVPSITRAGCSSCGTLHERRACCTPAAASLPQQHSCNPCYHPPPPRGPPLSPADLSTLAHDPEHEVVKRNMERRLREASFEGHDLLGTPRLLRRVSGSPDMLLPAVQAMRITQ